MWHVIGEAIFTKLFCMNLPIEIRFEFPLAHSDLAISLRATVTVHHSEIYYVVDDFRFAGENYRQRELSLLPAQEIQKVKRGHADVWVHKDSQRESQLSRALGRAIERQNSLDGSFKI